MSPHKKTYCTSLGLDQGDIILCECCQSVAVDVHAIQCDGMGGRKSTHFIENLMAICRKCHYKYGDKKHFKGWLYRVHLQRLEDMGAKFDRELINELIQKHAN